MSKKWRWELIKNGNITAVCEAHCGAWFCYCFFFISWSHPLWCWSKCSDFWQSLQRLLWCHTRSTDSKASIDLVWWDSWHTVMIWRWFEDITFKETELPRLSLNFVKPLYIALRQTLFQQKNKKCPCQGSWQLVSCISLCMCQSSHLLLCNLLT